MSEKSDAREARAEAKEQVRADAAEAASAAETANAAKAEAVEVATSKVKPTASKPASQTVIPGLYRKTSDQSLVYASVVDGGEEVMLREPGDERKGLGKIPVGDFLKPGVYARVIN